MSDLRSAEMIFKFNSFRDPFARSLPTCKDDLCIPSRIPERNRNASFHGKLRKQQVLPPTTVPSGESLKHFKLGAVGRLVKA